VSRSVFILTGASGDRRFLRAFSCVPQEIGIADGIHRLGDFLINSYMVGEGSEVTMIDAGVPGYWSGAPAELAAMGRSVMTFGRSS
jgi:hypothetical protein